MAIFIRRYQFEGPTTTDLIKEVSPTAAIAATFPGPIIDVQLDSAEIGVADDADTYMATQHYVPVPGAPAPGGMAWYGTGTDGDHVAVLGETWVIDPGPAPPQNFLKLWNNVTIPAGVTVRMGVLGDWQSPFVYIMGTLTIEPGGFLIADGGDGVLDAVGSGGGGLFGGRIAAGDGAPGTVGPSPGIPSNSQFPVPQRSQLLAGGPGQDVGGVGGNSSTQAGGTTSPTTNSDAYPYSLTAIDQAGKATSFCEMANGGGGGNGGGSEDGASTSGAGGGGGGVIFLHARHIVAQPGAIHARGGNGGDAQGADAGGGGGGSGGTVMIITADTAAPVCDVAPGTGGAGVGPGTAGAIGNPGTIVVFNPDLGLLFSSP